jgi:hypothetical protein
MNVGRLFDRVRLIRSLSLVKKNAEIIENTTVKINRGIYVAVLMVTSVTNEPRRAEAAEPKSAIRVSMEMPKKSGTFKVKRSKA